MKYFFIHLVWNLQDIYRIVQSSAHFQWKIVQRNIWLKDCRLAPFFLVADKSIGCYSLTSVLGFFKELSLTIRVLYRSSVTSFCFVFSQKDTFVGNTYLRDLVNHLSSLSYSCNLFFLFILLCNIWLNTWAGFYLKLLLWFFWINYLKIWFPCLLFCVIMLYDKH